jgi:hypothetical protein
MQLREKVAHLPKWKRDKVAGQGIIRLGILFHGL